MITWGEGGRYLPPAFKAPLAPASQAWLDGIPSAPYDAMWDGSPCRLRPLPAGNLAITRDGARTGMTVPVLAYLLETPEALFLVDCGLAPGVTDAATVVPDDSSEPSTAYVPEPPSTQVAQQLQGLHLRPDRFVCTHLHADHAGGAAAIEIPVEAGAADIAALGEPGASRQGYAVAELEGVPLRALTLDPGAPVGPFPASLRLSDSVLAVDTSGHTPGSISLLACIGPAWALICGDAAYPRLDDPGSPAFLAMLRIRRALDEVPQLRVFAAHDTTILRTAGDGWMGRPTDT